MSDDGSRIWTLHRKQDGALIAELVPEFLLHIDGDRAWWRWSDEPFDEDP